ncbi:hypothetical protein FGG08_002815 [Glutinoglossum americanum]|uniref:RNA-binding protein n=1 Tax=Glutinoglossum americanum TaxID=1670608 RepID=A0A9P8L480_9PEZI|nr:hypothetical protein FGG08_002815 [Glutinoglossum americanum]
MFGADHDRKVLINGNANIHGRNEGGGAFAHADEDSDAGGVTFSRPTQSVQVKITAPPGGQDHAFDQSYTSRNGSGVLRQRSGNNHPQLPVNENECFPSDATDKDEAWNVNGHGRSKADKHGGGHLRNDQRTLLFTNLSDRTTHKDIVSVIRGGMLLDIYLRSAERTASVSFVDGSAAQEFFSHAKRRDIYIHGKRVVVKWNERQFILPGHVANNINNGATRNIVLRSVNPSITAQRLREDLDHIHNLVIIDIFFQNGNAHVSLNSVHNALFARTCMMSRGGYKGIKIEWYADECAAPWPKKEFTQRKENVPPPTKKTPTMTNRFDLLNMDGTEDGEDDDTTDLTVTSDFSPYDNSLSWAENAVSA